MRKATEVTTILRYPDLLGEGPAYDATRARWLWVDVLGERFRELLVASTGGWEVGRTWEPGGFISAVIPRAAGGVLAICGTKVISFPEQGDKEIFASFEEAGRFSLNDAKCDPQGRLVIGWIALDEGRVGGAVRLNTDGSMERIVSNIAVANGLDWSPDGKTFYLVDTVALCVEAFDYEGSGELGNRRQLLSIERGVGAPDGMAVDHEGCLWVAVPYAGEIRRYSPDGTFIEAIHTPTRMPTSCAFGGSDGGELLITSQAQGLASPDRENGLGITLDRVRAGHQDPVAGALLTCRPGVSGPSARPFAG